MNWDLVATPKGIETRVLSGGSGPPLVYFHGAWGLEPNLDLLEALSDDFAVHAPELPGFGTSEGELLLDDMLDFTLHGWDVIDALQIEGPILVGHSMGAMIAAEMAVLAPARPDSLVLVAPLGLWTDADPMPDLFATLPQKFPELLFLEPTCEGAKRHFALDFDDDEEMIEFLVGTHRRFGTAGKLLFPIPDRHLSKRLYRLATPTHLIWADSDNLIPSTYGARWSAAIPHATTTVTSSSGHLIPLEQPAELAAQIRSSARG